jgi:ATP phosphoribosyltransferase
MALIDNCKTALRVVTTAYDTEIQQYIDAAQLDLGIAGVKEVSDALVDQAIITYVKMRFGHPSNYTQLKEAYDEQKAQLMNATGYTEWSVGE